MTSTHCLRARAGPPDPFARRLHRSYEIQDTGRVRHSGTQIWSPGPPVAEELVAPLKKIGSDQVGVCVDTGNNMTLLEDPMEVVEALAPWAMTTHFKDMGVEEYERGFRVAQVPFSASVLDLPRIVRTLRAAKPKIPINLEMITRDLLDVPCLGNRYWATFPDLPGRHLARTLSYVRAHPPARPLPQIAREGLEEGLRAEDENIRQCLTYAKDHL